MIWGGSGRPFEVQGLFELGEAERPQWLLDGCRQMTVPNPSPLAVQVAL